MKQNIKNNHTRRLDAKLYSAKYYDFMLFKGETLKFGKNYLDNLKIADFSNFNIKDGILYKIEYKTLKKDGITISSAATRS